MLSKVNSGRLYNSITRHNRLLVDYSKGESESKGMLKCLKNSIFSFFKIPYGN